MRAGFFQKFESMAGLASPSLVEENVAQVAELQILEKKLWMQVVGTRDGQANF